MFISSLLMAAIYSVWDYDREVGVGFFRWEWRKCCPIKLLAGFWFGLFFDLTAYPENILNEH